LSEALRRSKSLSWGHITHPDDRPLDAPELIAVRTLADGTRLTLYKTIENPQTGGKGFMTYAGDSGIIGGERLLSHFYRSAGRFPWEPWPVGSLE
jgi:hypothetical protein